jgi:adenine-specific DNA-methyltransferase
MDIREYIQHKLKTYDAASEFFGELGYGYAGDAPVPTRNWPESVQRHKVQPQYIAEHGDFKVIYCELPGERMLRTIQRPIIDQLAREHMFFMVVFHQKHGNKWDFVNVTVMQDDDSRVRRVARRISITNAERIQNRLRTATNTLEQIDINRQQNITALELQSLHNQAFDVEQVTKNFYSQYTKVFTVLSDDIAQRNPSFKQDASREALKLLDRLMFLYFIQKKGWLNQEYDYLYSRFEHYQDEPDKGTYFDDVIKTLFNALATRGDQPENASVPFLNGGLFQPDNQMKHLSVGNHVFQTAFEELFEKYNFTVEEDMPDDRAVAIDPEMLGKVFESLILNIEQEKDLRKSTGSYYTPRTIVSFMCQQSLREYIVQEWRDRAESDANKEAYQERIISFVEDGDASALSEEEAQQIRDWLLDVRVIDPAVGSGAFLVGMLQEIIRLVTLLDEHTKQHDIIDPNYAYGLKREIIGHCLYGVDIQAQAVQICELRLWLSLVVDYEPEQNGRDFSEWIGDIEPLPNLSYLVRQGNSLIEQVLGKTVKFDFGTHDFSKSELLIDELGELKSTYFRSTDPGVKSTIDREILTKQAELTEQLLKTLSDERQKVFNQKFTASLPGLEKPLSRKEQKQKEELNAELDELSNLKKKANDIRKKAEKAGSDEDRIKQLRKQLGAFIWRVDFGEVFAERGGFDIAIANPPYIRQEKIKHMKDDLKALFTEVYTGTADLYVYFYAQALRLLKDNGVLTFISPNKFLLAKYGKQLRQHLSQETTLELLIDFGDLPVFDATTYPFITITRQHTPEKDNETRILNVNEMEILVILTDTARNSDSIRQSSLQADGWQLINKPTQDLLNKLRGTGKPLSDYADGQLFIGVKTGFNAAFIIDKETRDYLINAHETSKGVIKSWLRGRDVKRWKVNAPELFVIFIPRGKNIDDYPAIAEYLSQHKERLTPGKYGGRKAGSYKWWEIQDNVAYHEQFSKTKIVWPDIAKQCEFTLDNSGAYPDMTLFTITKNDKYLLGILNSSLTNWVISKVSPSIQNNYLRFKRAYVSQISIPDSTLKQRQHVETLVQELLEPDKRRSEIKRLERELNNAVYEIYNLDDEEISIIESNIKEATRTKVLQSLDDLDWEGGK